MIDLHCHILPGVDDGADSLATACEMAAAAWSSGTDCLVATPHFCRPDQRDRLRPLDYQRRVRRLQQTLAEQGCPLRLAAGMEVFATPELPALLDRQEVLTLAGSRYLLVEFYFDESPGFMDETFRAITDRGLTPVVAHPERYDAVQRRPERVAEWFAQGFLIQLNKGTVLGQMGSGAHKAAWWLLRRGLAHVVASDAHHFTYRTPTLSRVREVIGQNLSWQYAAVLLEENPERILHNQKIVPALQ